MASADLVSGSPGGGERSALSDLLSRSIIHEKAGAVVPRDLLQFGLLGSILVIATGLLALIFPGAESIRQGGFFFLFGGQVADLASIMEAAAIPAIVCGIALLGLDLYLMQTPSSDYGRAAVVAQAAAGGVGGTVSTVFLALVILNLAIWAILIACGVAIVLIVFGVMAGGG
jgi:hypothetical protein